MKDLKHHRGSSAKPDTMPIIISGLFGNQIVWGKQLLQVESCECVSWWIHLFIYLFHVVFILLTSFLFISSSFVDDCLTLCCRIQASGSWRQGRWCWLMEAFAASMSSAASGSMTKPASMRPWSNRPSVWPRWGVTFTPCWTGVVSVCGVARVKAGLVLSVFAVLPGWRLDWCCQCLWCCQGEGWTGVSIFGVANVKGGLSDWCCRFLRCGQGEGWTGVVSVCSVAKVKGGLVLSVFAGWPRWRVDWCCQCLQCGQGEGWTGVVSVCSVAKVKGGLVLSVFAGWPRWRVDWCCQCLQCGQGEGWTGVGFCCVARVKVGLVLSVFAVWPRWRVAGRADVSVCCVAKVKGGWSGWCQCLQCGQGEGWLVGLMSVFAVWPRWRVAGRADVSVCSVAKVKGGWSGWCQCLLMQAFHPPAEWCSVHMPKR